MHDPLVVAFEIRRPWPKRIKAGKTLPASLRWPSMITVWHREPNGHDAGDVCKQHSRYQDAEGKWQWKFHHGWRFHIHHWSIQVPALQAVRRRVLTRCAWCGGRSVKGDQVNVSLQWDGPRGRWWRGEPGLYHQDCSSIDRAHATCVCEHPVLEYDGYGRCARCDAYRAYGTPDEALDRARELKAIPAGGRRHG